MGWTDVFINDRIAFYSRSHEDKRNGTLLGNRYSLIYLGSRSAIKVIHFAVHIEDSLNVCVG